MKMLAIENIAIWRGIVNESKLGVILLSASNFINSNVKNEHQSKQCREMIYLTKNWEHLKGYVSALLIRFATSKNSIKVYLRIFSLM